MGMNVTSYSVNNFENTYRKQKKSGHKWKNLNAKHEVVQPEN